MAERIPARERVMRQALKEAGETISEHIQNPRSSAKETLNELIEEVDNKAVAGAMSESERAEDPDDYERREAAKRAQHERLVNRIGGSASDRGGAG
jgi:uncharacterized membrane protein